MFHFQSSNYLEMENLMISPYLHIEMLNEICNFVLSKLMKMPDAKGLP